LPHPVDSSVFGDVTTVHNLTLDYSQAWRRAFSSHAYRAQNICLPWIRFNMV